MPYNTLYGVSSIILYGCEKWYLTLREQRRIKVLENSILRRIFGPKRNANGEWRLLHNDELHSLHLSPNIVRERSLED